MRALPGILLLLAIGACERQPDPAAEEAALRSADSSYTVAMQTLDIPGLVAFYLPDAVMYPPGEATPSGLDAIREYATTFASAPGLNMRAQLQTLWVSRSGDLGYSFNIVDATANDSAGKPVTERLRDIHLWRKNPGGQWKVAVDVWNAMPVGSGTATP